MHRKKIRLLGSEEWLDYPTRSADALVQLGLAEYPEAPAKVYKQAPVLLRTAEKEHKASPVPLRTAEKEHKASPVPLRTAKKADSKSEGGGVVSMTGKIKD